MINADVSVKEQLIKVDLILDLFEILVPVNRNLINHEMLVNENCKCRRRLTDGIVEKCDEDIDENEIVYNGTLNDYGDYASLVFQISQMNVWFAIIDCTINMNQKYVLVTIIYQR